MLYNYNISIFVTFQLKYKMRQNCIHNSAVVLYFNCFQFVIKLKLSKFTVVFGKYGGYLRINIFSDKSPISLAVKLFMHQSP